MTINLEDEVIIKQDTSCSVDEAAAKLLGFMRDPRRKKYTLVTKRGIPFGELQHLYELDVPLLELLGQWRDDAWRDILDVAATRAFRKLVKDGELDAAGALIEPKSAALLQFDALLLKAHGFLSDLADELGKGDASALRIDRRATDKSGEVRITLTSLDEWAQVRHGISTRCDVVSETGESAASADPPEEDVAAGEGLSPTKARNFARTFLGLVCVLAAKAGSKFINDGKLNANQLAELLRTEGAKMIPGGTLKDLSERAIRERIADAERRARW